jgi:hypothetical protein
LAVDNLFVSAVHINTNEKCNAEEKVIVILVMQFYEELALVNGRAGAGNFSLHHRVQNGSEAHPASYPMGTRGSLPGCKAAGA